MLQSLNSIFELNHRLKILLALLWDFSIALAAITLAYWVRLGISDERLGSAEYAMIILHPFSTIVVLSVLGHYRQVTRYLGSRSAYIMFAGLFFSSSLLFLYEYWLDAFLPHSVPFIFLSIAFAGIAGIRLLLQSFSRIQDFKSSERCIVYGCTDSALVLVNLLRQSRKLVPIAFIDQKQRNVGKQFLGLHVYSINDVATLAKKYGVSKVLLAVPKSRPARRKALIEALEPHALELLTVPNFDDIITGEKKIDELVEVDINQLLGREPVPPVEDLLGGNIANKVVMVTGAGGSIGSELCRQIVKLNPTKLVLYELAEFNLYQIENELSRQFPDIEIEAMIGSAQDGSLVRETIRRFGVQTIYHTAAYKHVPIVESNVIAGVRNNVFGTAEVAQAAAELDVEKFVLISTDKAVRPTNVMGATKRLSELFVQGLARMESQTEFAIVRFGNVLGSSGSVVPLFTKQIRGGGPVTITHPDIIRYFMTIPEAALLVIQAGAMGQKGEVFVLDMGEPVRIIDLATKMAHLMGHRLNFEKEAGDIEVKFTGLRPGEKLYEELLIDDADTETVHPQIMGADEQKLPFDQVLTLLDQINFAIHCQDTPQVLKLLQEAPLAYTPAKH